MNFTNVSLNTARSARLLAQYALIAVLTTAIGLAAEPATGTWQGSLAMGTQNLRLVLHVSGDAKKGFTATMDSPDQEAQIGALALGMKVDTFSATADKVDFEMKTIQAQYAGKLNSKLGTIVGSWTQGGSSLPLTFKKMPATAKAASTDPGALAPK